MGNQPWPQFQNGIRERSIIRLNKVPLGVYKPFCQQPASLEYPWKARLIENANANGMNIYIRSNILFVKLINGLLNKNATFLKQLDLDPLIHCPT